jgi:biopolymer transport protein ExbD
MATFGKKEKSLPAISTASLPDIVFMLLFFFMVTTKLRETDVLVNVSLPAATQLQKLENKNLVSYIYIGKPKEAKFGQEPRIQINDVIITPEQIPDLVAQERSKLKENERDDLVISMKVDRNAKVGILTDVKQQLREADARQINYATVGSKQ